MTVVMDETSTFVTWPSRLKIGAKTKKDPHIKVAGRPDDVRAAREKIMQILNARQNNRVTMKLDVSYTDHSHIIGKGGLTIKRVMEETGCHIHFPDSNRSNHQEKSNQVSIAGEMEGVERARARVRNLTPLVFTFELPIMGSTQSTPDLTSPYVVKIQEKYNVQVMFRTQPKLHATLVVVKGCEWEVSKAKDATLLLIHYMCDHLANQIQVQMSMEISPQHHSIVLGKQNSNLKMIMQRTATQIMFPDAGDPYIPSLKKSNVIITGAIRNVYLARQQLVGSLPLVLMFDLPENTTPSVATDSVSQLMQTLDVFINVRPKPNQPTLSVIIKGIERNASNIYEARRRLLGLDEPRVHAEIPETYHIPNAENVFQGNNNASNGGNASLLELADNFSNILSINTQNSAFCMSPMSHSPNPLGLSPHWTLPSSLFSPLPLPHNYPYQQMNHLQTGVAGQMMQPNPSMPQHQNLTAQNLLGIGQLQQHLAAMRNYGGMRNWNGNLQYDSKGGSADSSLSSASSSLSSSTASPRNISPVNPSENMDFGMMEKNIMLSDIGVGDRRAPGCEKKILEMAAQSNLSSYDYDQKRIMAVKAVQNRPKANEYRVPNSTWSGYGLSESMPPITETNEQDKKHLADTSELWDDELTPVGYKPFNFSMNTSKEATPIGMTSNYLEHTPSSQLEKITSENYNELATMLTSVNLEKYIRLFVAHEVDLATFPTLTEKDLCEIGITAWGAKRKLLLLISEMKKRSSPFSGAAAPGAERKINTSASGASVAVSIAPTSTTMTDRTW
ncbi:protein bicaudal C isoform X2 [Venturia canescens]|uniref:protein bicaudal C isoform X2 n=1 Tax=Venturia canescens TaxID=32260 RepID=UPI001C9BD8AE|nr:protein bicaudal C isoform X2 [Venturia canescens]